MIEVVVVHDSVRRVRKRKKGGRGGKEGGRKRRKRSGDIVLLYRHTIQKPTLSLVLLFLVILIIVEKVKYWRKISLCINCIMI